MRVYYMTSFEVALKHILLEQRMKVSRFQDLNDPFELNCHDAGHKNSRARLEAFGRTANERFGLICFGKDWKSPVMWAHYADKHNGLCLGFDVHDHYVGLVNYVDSRLIPFVGEGVRNSVEFIEEMLYHKAQQWSYEKEVRAIVLLAGPKRPLQHISFGTQLQLREVIIGARCALSPSDLAPFILPQETTVTIRKGRTAFKAFEIVENRRYRTVTVPARRDCRVLHGKPRSGPRFLLRTPLAKTAKGND